MGITGCKLFMQDVFNVWWCKTSASGMTSYSVTESSHVLFFFFIYLSCFPNEEKGQEIHSKFKLKVRALPGVSPTTVVLHTDLNFGKKFALQK